MKKMLWSVCCMLMMHCCAAQQKNIIKLSVGDCINCVSSLSHILQKDPSVTFVVRRDSAPDSTDIWERFDLTVYREHFIWSNKLYDSLSKETESELIQYCNNTEVSRSGLKQLKFFSIENCVPNTSFVDTKK